MSLQTKDTTPFVSMALCTEVAACVLLQLPAMSPRQSQNQPDVPHGLSPPCKRANSSLEHARDAAAATVSPEKKLCISRPDVLPGEQHLCPQATDSGMGRVQPGHVVQLKAAHDAYVAALYLGSQLDAAKPDKPQQPCKHSWQPQQHAHQQSCGQVQEGQMQQGMQHQHQHQQPHQGQQQHAHMHHCQPPLPPSQLQPHQQQQQQQLMTEQQQALAAYQAALGRPVGQPPMQLPQQAPHQLPQQPAVHLLQEVPQQVPRRVPGQAGKHLGLPLPCTSAQAQNVYRAFQWQKDAIDYADACNQRAAGLPAHVPEGQGRLQCLNVALVCLVARTTAYMASTA